MQDLPHQYQVNASAELEGNVVLKADELPQLITAPPAEFGGPGDQWSPETLLVSSVVGCLILTFRAMARGSKVPWISLDCTAEGVLDRVESITRFTGFQINAELTIPSGTSEERADRLLHRAEQFCLITNSLKARPQLVSTIRTVD